MEDKIKIIKENFERDIKNNINDLNALRDIEIKYLGKKSQLNALLKSIGTIKDIEQKKVFGKNINILKKEISEKIALLKQELQNKHIEKNIKSDFDISIPIKIKNKGSLNPITLIQRNLEKIFTGMGFTIVTGPEMETEYYNFEALNIPKEHPARDMQDTFWLKNGKLLRTQTSTCQIRAMEKYGAPLRIIAPGKCFRYEAMDASHENTFYQMEGLLIDENITIANLIATMKTLLSEIFKKDINIRLRPGYFPFVEPGFELDIQCLICNGKGCKTCKNSGWLELLPCGMVHPNVLKMSGIDNNKYNGFAFGLGLTRLAMMKYNIHDIRLFLSGDLRFLRQFK